MHRRAVLPDYRAREHGIGVTEDWVDAHNHRLIRGIVGAQGKGQRCVVGAEVGRPGRVGPVDRASDRDVAIRDFEGAARYRIGQRCRNQERLSAERQRPASRLVADRRRDLGAGVPVGVSGDGGGNAECRVAAHAVPVSNHDLRVSGDGPIDGRVQRRAHDHPIAPRISQTAASSAT